MRLQEMARPVKICPDCGKSMSGNHFWYKGGWRCKKSNTSSATAPTSSAAPRPAAQTTSSSGPVVSRTSTVNKMLKGTSQNAAAQTPTASTPSTSGSTSGVKEWMEKWKVTNFSEGPNGVVVDEDTEVQDFEKDKLPFKFDIVKGDFIISAAGLKTLENTPNEVTGDFFADHLDISSFAGGPKKVGGSYVVGGTSVTSFDGAAAQIENDLHCEDCKQLTSLQGIHKNIKHIGGKASFADCPITSHVLGLLLIDGLQSVKLDEVKVMEVINKHLKGERDTLMCQQELIDGGFADFAKL